MSKMSCYLVLVYANFVKVKTKVPIFVYSEGLILSLKMRIRCVKCVRLIKKSNYIFIY